jgi:DNA-binding GntR family transcriptional regulator
MATKASASTARKQKLTMIEGDGQNQGAPLLTDQAYNAIKEKILSLELAPGKFINELTLCQLFGLSRTPVHHAVHRLMLEGLIEVIPRKGLIIRPDSLNEVMNLLEARRAVEPNIAALAAERAQEEQLAELKRLLDESAKYTDQRHRAKFMSIDRAFHAIVANAASNPVFGDVMRPLHERSARIWHLRIWQEDDLQVTQDEHVAIYKALAEGDAAGAIKAMQKHLDSLRSRILRSQAHSVP